MTVPKLYHHTFSPWTVADGTRVIASERAWSKLLKLDKDAAKTGERIRVNIGVDVFEDWTGGMSNTQGRLLNADWKPASPGDGVRMLSMSDVLHRSFDLIDTTPNLDWLLLTKRPENIAVMLPAYFPGGYIAEAGRMNQEGPRPNVWLGTSVENQKTADERIPHFLKVPAAVRYVMLTPREEIDLRRWLPESCECGFGPLANDTKCPDCGERAGGQCELRLVVVSGDTEPLHPDCVRSLRDQCQAAGVPFWFEGWGEWAPGNFGPGGDLYDRDRTKIESGMFDYSGHWNSGGPNPFRQTMDRVGKKAAGRTLDGREWNELPEVGK